MRPDEWYGSWFIIRRRDVVMMRSEPCETQDASSSLLQTAEQHLISRPFSRITFLVNTSSRTSSMVRILAVLPFITFALSFSPPQQLKINRKFVLGAEQDRDNEGQELANEFYDLVRERKLDTSASQTSDDSREAPPKQYFKKFTGSPPTTPVASGSLFSQTPETDAIRREREREFGLAGRFEQTLPLQAGILLIFAVLVTWVGLSGGITDGSERDFADFDEIIIMGEDANEKPSVFL